MSPELQKYYEDYFDLFSNKGWNQLKEDFKNNALAINSVEAAKDENDLHFRKGQLSVIAHVLNLEAMVEQGYNDAQESEDAA